MRKEVERRERSEEYGGFPGLFPQVGRHEVSGEVGTGDNVEGSGEGVGTEGGKMVAAGW